MNIWIVLAVFGLLAVVGFAVAGSFESEPVEEKLPSCGGGCLAGNSCGSPTCGVETTGSCGCGRG